MRQRVVVYIILVLVMVREGSETELASSGCRHVHPVGNSGLPPSLRRARSEICSSVQDVNGAAGGAVRKEGKGGRDNHQEKKFHARDTGGTSEMKTKSGTVLGRRGDVC